MFTGFEEKNQERVKLVDVDPNALSILVNYVYTSQVNVTEANVQRLCLKAAKPLRADILSAIGMEEIGLNVGAVCVYPSR